jgi:hypothetical protein
MINSAMPLAQERPGTHRTVTIVAAANAAKPISIQSSAGSGLLAMGQNQTGSRWTVGKPKYKQILAKRDIVMLMLYISQPIVICFWLCLTKLFANGELLS